MGIRYFLFVALVASSLPAMAAVVKVIDNNGLPVAGASVLIGQGVDQPFTGNKVTTDANGQFTTPGAWTQALPVTIEASGFVRATHIDVLPNVGQLTLSQDDGDERIEISGTLTDYGVIRTDGKVDAGAFIPAVPRNQLLYFDVGWLVSPEYDTLRVLGREVAIPSNIVLPRQQENYIFPITLDKPNFRMFVRKPGKYRFLAVHGQFPLKRVVDDFRAGAPAYDIINHANLLQTGMVDLNVSGKIQNLSVPVNNSVFNSTITVQAPSMAQDDVILSVALTDVDGGLLLPSDVKRLRNNQPQELKTPSGKTSPTALSLWFKEHNNNFRNTAATDITAEDMLEIPMNLIYELFQENYHTQAASVDYKQVSFAIHTQIGQAPKFLSHVMRPKINGNQLLVTPPSNNQGIKPMATLLMYSAIKMNGSGDVKTEERTRLWEVWTTGWASTINLPNLASLPKTQADKFRWEVLYLGNDGSEITHVSRNALDL